MNSQAALKSKLISQAARRQGFSLVEILLVLVILAAVAAMVIPNLLGASEQANQRMARVQIGNIEQALKAYRMDVNTFPTTEQGLAALIEPPSDLEEDQVKNYRTGGYLDRQTAGEFKDPWNTPIQFVSDGIKGEVNADKPDIASAGPDREFGTADDIANYTSTN